MPCHSPSQALTSTRDCHQVQKVSSWHTAEHDAGGAGSEAGISSATLTAGCSGAAQVLPRSWKRSLSDPVP